jgi:hypothetical protein
MNVKLNGETYDAQNLNGTRGYCYKNTGWKNQDLYDKSQCLPDTANPTYEWGFSTMLAGVFIIINFLWSIGMYVVWQNAQFNSSLVWGGYSMTPLRAAFAMAKVAKHRTGLGEKQLVRAETKDLEKELYGYQDIKGSKVDYNLFFETIEDEDEDDYEDDQIVRRRRTALRRDEVGSQQTLASPNACLDEK